VGLVGASSFVPSCFFPTPTAVVVSQRHRAFPVLRRPALPCAPRSHFPSFRAHSLTHSHFTSLLLASASASRRCRLPLHRGHWHSLLLIRHFSSFGAASEIWPLFDDPVSPPPKRRRTRVACDLQGKTLSSSAFASAGLATPSPTRPGDVACSCCEAARGISSIDGAWKALVRRELRGCCGVWFSRQELTELRIVAFSCRATFCWHRI